MIIFKRRQQSADCLLGVVTQPTDSRLSETKVDEPSKNNAVCS